MDRMSRTIPTVADVMSAAPHSIAAHESIKHARRIMKEYGIRHLPVTKDDKLVGVVSDRDLRVADAASSSRIELSVEDIVFAQPYTVAPTTSLSRVARAMAEAKVGSAVVVDHGRILGVFTTIDALYALADSLDGKTPRAQLADATEHRPNRPKTRRTGREAIT